MPQAKKPALVRTAISKALYSVSLIRRRAAVHTYSHAREENIDLPGDSRSVDDEPGAQPQANVQADPQPYTSEEIRFISQCEMLLPGCPAVGLSGESSLTTWMDAWEDAGILNESARAMLGRMSDLVSMLERNKLKLVDVNERQWPELGLRALLEKVRIELNQIARHGSPVVRDDSLPGQATAACLHQGTEAPMIDWVRVWISAGMSREIVAAVSGIGFRHLPGSTISHCEMSKASFHVRLFTPAKSKRQRSGYVLSGYWYEGTDCTYAYHPMTRDKISSIDSYNWIAGHQLGVTRQQRGSHPIELIKRVMGERYSEVSGKHCLGLLIETLAPGDAVFSRVAPEVHDVITHGRMQLALGSPTLLDGVMPHRMPGVYPATWLVDCGVDTDAEESSGAYLYRVVSAYESIVNGWFHRVAAEVSLPGIEAGSFRNAKCSGADGFSAGDYVLSCPASVFAVRTTDHATAVSIFRLPLGSVMGAVLVLNGEKRQRLELTIKQIISLLKDILANPLDGLHDLLHWIVFDAVSGALPQMPYRYQIVLAGDGLSLAAIPFWSSESATAYGEQTLRLFGFQIAIDDDSTTALLANAKLAELAAAAGTDPSELISFRDACLGAFKQSEPVILSQPAAHEGKKMADSFRNAKWKAARF